MRALVIAVSTATLALGLAACGGDDTAPASSGATQSAAPSAPGSASPKATQSTKATPTPDVVAVSIAVNGRSVDPAPSRIKVPVDSKVRLTVSSDVANEIHVHGYELYKDVTPGKPAVITFTADQAGLFEIETHESPVLVLGQLQVQ